MLPEGFLAAGDTKQKTRLGLILCEKGASTWGFFTKNKMKAETLKITIGRLKKRRKFKALLVVAGNAMCCAEKAKEHALKLTEKLAKELGIEDESVLILSTGKIGTKLPLKDVMKAIPRLADGLSKNVDAFSKAILTTDTRPKVSTFAKNFKVVGIAKGAGMIMPSFSTTLSFVLTDATLNAGREELLNIVSTTVGSINVDGCMSTNDSSLVMSSSMVTADKEDVLKGIKSVYSELAFKIVSDGEGATKILIVRIDGARTQAEARRAFEFISSSALLKCALFGGKVDMGRVIAALGASMVKTGKVNIFAGKIVAVKDGIIKKSPPATATITINLGAGSETYEGYMCDLSPDYVKINM